ncbi:MAG: DUF3854 domain-containing protein [Brasilonema angustatum HA4187-MV1]|nr:DUF3854 domain-containing protein [Brasilonema angustatum HA4187-MV1]
MLYALPNTARRNDGRLRDGILKQYAHLMKGGWWVSGLDPLNDWQPMLWGRFKSDHPRQEWDKETQQYSEKKVKYESPPKTRTRVTYFRVTLSIWLMIAIRYKVAMPEHIQITEDGEAPGFWAWVQQHPEIPIKLTEGEKKAACLLSLGFVAIALPGIWNGRVGKKSEGEIEYLHPDLIPVAQPNRKFIILFDYETKPETRHNVEQATRRTGWAIERAGCQCEVALLPGPEKGVDDWAMALGEKAEETLSALFADTLTLKEYHFTFHYNRRRGLIRYKPDVKVNCRYLSDQVTIPKSGLVCLLSDMGTGKTELAARRRLDYPNERFLNIGHRVNLLKNLALRLKTDMYSDLGSLGLTKAIALSITIDSLHRLADNLQAYGCLLIDEARQFVSHLLTSSTCQKHRVEIIQVLKYLVYQATLVILADAHLDDVTINFFREMRPQPEQPYIVQNDYRSGGRQVFWYESNDNSTIVARLHAEIMAGKKVLVVSSSRRFPKTLERALLNTNSDKKDNEQKKQGGKGQKAGGRKHSSLPTSVAQQESQSPSECPPVPLPFGETNSDTQPLLRLWTIHGENSGSPENIDFIKDINNAVKTVDVLNVSPSLGTGIDISQYHFDVIFGVFDGDSLAATDAAQQLWRYRPNVPMHAWVRPRPSFGYKEINVRRIKESILQKNEMAAFLIRIDPKTGRRGVEDEWMLDAYCQMQSEHNFSVNNLRTDLRLLLEEMGNTIIPVREDKDENTSRWMKNARNAIKSEHCAHVAKAKTIDRTTYEHRQHQDYLKPEEILECQRFQIQEAYGMNVTPELVEKHSDGRLLGQLIALEAILAEPDNETLVDEIGREYPAPPTFVAEYDRQERQRLKICMDWSNRSTEWMMRYRLGLREILLELMAGKEIAANDPRLKVLAEQALRAAPHIKSILGLTIAPNKSPMWILSQFLNQLGLTTISQRLGQRGDRIRIYSLNPEDVAFAHQVLAWRQQRREEREHQRQQDAEAAQRRLNAMNVRYRDNPVSIPPPIVYTAPPLSTVDTNAESTSTHDGESWWNKVKAVAQQAWTLLGDGIEQLKEMLASLTSEERWGVMLTLDDMDSAGFAKFTTQFPEWERWCSD